MCSTARHSCALSTVCRGTRRIPAGGVNTWIHVDDAAVATVAALERGAPGRAYNIADDNPITWQEFFAEVAGRHRTPRPIRLPA